MLISRGFRAELSSPDEVVARDVTTQQVGEAVAAAGLVVYEMKAEEQNLEDAFLELTADEEEAIMTALVAANYSSSTGPEPPGSSLRPPCSFPRSGSSWCWLASARSAVRCVVARA